MHLRNSRLLSLCAFAASHLLLLGGCGMHTEAVYPTKVTGSDKILYTDEERNSVFGTPAAHSIEDKADAKAGPAENKHLWKAALEAVAALPIDSLDAPRGVILTDWYENPETPGQRLKYAIHIYDRKTGVESVNVSVSKQVKHAAEWRDAKVPEELGVKMRDEILLKAGEAVTGQ